MILNENYLFSGINIVAPLIGCDWYNNIPIVYDSRQFVLNAAFFMKDVLWLSSSCRIQGIIKIQSTWIGYFFLVGTYGSRTKDA